MRREIAVILLAALLAAPASVLAGDKHFFSLGGSFGQQMKNDPVWHTSGSYDWNNWKIYPAYGWKLTDRWELFLEGDFGVFNFKGRHGLDYKSQTIALGGNLMASYDFVRYKEISLFGEAGVGLGWWNKTPSEKLVKDDILGAINYGLGLKIPLKKHFFLDNCFLKLSYRGSHYSSLPSKDTGANSHQYLLRIVRYF